MAESSDPDGPGSIFEVPQVQVPWQPPKLAETLTARLPKPSEIVKPSELTERLLSAQKGLTSKVVAFASNEETPVPAAKATK